MSAKTKTKQTTPAQRIKLSLEYLKQNDIDINSRTDVHYLKAIEIAAGVNQTKK